MAQIQIAVNSMTNATSFLVDGPFEAMRKLKEIGISCVEISQHIQFDEETLGEYLRAEKELGMEICGISTGYRHSLPKGVTPFSHKGKLLRTYDCEKDYDMLLSYCRKLNCHVIRFAGFPVEEFQSMEDVRSYFTEIDVMAKRLKEDGIHFCAHNHEQEFDTVEGKTFFEWALELAPNLEFELDVLNAWLHGMDVVKLIQTAGGRIRLLHMQDYVRVGDGERAVGRRVETGEGILPYKEICQAAKSSGCEYFVIEQIESEGKDSYVSIAKSLKNLKGFL